MSRWDMKSSCLLLLFHLYSHCHSFCLIMCFSFSWLILWCFSSLNRSTRLKAVKSTKRESSSSSWLTWSRTTGGSDAPPLRLFFLFLLLFFWPGNALYRTTGGGRSSGPPSTSPHTFLTVKKIKHLHLPAFSTCTRTHLLIVKVNKRRPPSGATRWKTTSCESRRYFPRAFGIDPAHSQPAAAPPKHAYKWLWWRVDHYAKEERDFTERTFLSFLDGWLWLF